MIRDVGRAAAFNPRLTPWATFCRRPAAGVLAVLTLLAAQSAHAAGLPPDETVKRLKPADGFEVALAAAEPAIRQPVNITFDERGRLWVMQYLQYPAPAGLKPVSVDQYLRTKWDRVPDPPPRGPKGADRITILEDKDGDGSYESAKDFVTGLNIATGMEIGHGGVWVAQAPYLLFYPDRDRDDVPDGDPEVVLSGFGMEDTHAVVNHLTWGPDGWLYGAQGSTCTANVRGHVFHQAAWRYHPRTKQFEVFSEGGGNTFGLEWDQHGNLLTGTNYSNFVMVHYVQGGYFVKNFGKHGELSNPYAFGYFDHVPHANWRGGHVTQLGVVYQGGAFPPQYNGKWIAPNLLANNVDVHSIHPDGSSFKTKLEGEFLGSADPCFRPVDIRTGPDGAVYLADWYDVRANHVIPVDDWDKSTGRVYRVAPQGLAPHKPFDLAKLDGAELVRLLSHPNDWYARTARRILDERDDPAVVPALRAGVRQGKDPRLALQALWALYVSNGFDDVLAAELLGHAEPYVRAWTVRLLGDRKQVTPEIASRLVLLAQSEPSVIVRSQLACSARRLPAEQALPVVRELLRRGEDADDRYLPLMLWWAIETNVAEHRPAVLAMFEDAGLWESPLVRRHVAERLARRLAAEPSEAHFAACARLLELAPERADVRQLVAGMDKGLQGQRFDTVPGPLKPWIDRLRPAAANDPAFLRLALRLGDRAVVPDVLRALADPKADRAARLALAETAGQVASAECLPALLALLSGREPEEVRLAALSALQNFSDERIAPEALRLYPTASARLRSRILAALCSRPAWARALVTAVEGGEIPKADITPEHVRLMALHNDRELAALLSKHWGGSRAGTPKEKAESIARVREILRTGDGDPSQGKVVFTNVCAACHTFHGEGKAMGPDLTAADRKDLDALLANVIDPSANVRPEYGTWVLHAADGRVLTGTIADMNPATVTIDDGERRVTVARDKVKKFDPSPVSRMPEGLLEALAPQQVRDLFAYLAADAPPAGR